MTEQDQKKIFAKNLRYYISQTQKSQKEIADALHVSPQTFNTWCQGIALPRMGKVQLLANYFNINKSDLIEEHSLNTRSPESYGLARFSDVHKKAIPLLGTVACGAPIYANEEHDSYVLADEDIDADYCLTARGDSMINARIYDGDLIFVKQCDHVENGEIAVVAIHDEVTLKRVYFYPETHTLQLIAENPKYPPLIYHDEELDGVYVIGKALFFQALIRS